jgi:hypothetical protein
MRVQISSTELRSALVQTLETLAPLGGEREIPAIVYAETLLYLLVSPASMRPPQPEDVDALVAMFRARVEAMIEEHRAPGRVFLQ